MYAKAACPPLPGVVPCSEAACAASSSGLSKCSCFQGFGRENTARQSGAWQRDSEKKEGDECLRSDLKRL